MATDSAITGDASEYLQRPSAPAVSGPHPSDASSAIITGTVKTYNPLRGYGFIAAADGNEYFAHQTKVKAAGFRSLRVGEPVEFKAVIVNGRPQAMHITGPGGANVLGSEVQSRNVVPPGVCRNFMRGLCNRGDSCRFAHTTGGVTAAAPAAYQQYGMVGMVGGTQAAMMGGAHAVMMGGAQAMYSPYVDSNTAHAYGGYSYGHYMQQAQAPQSAAASGYGPAGRQHQSGGGANEGHPYPGASTATWSSEHGVEQTTGEQLPPGIEQTDPAWNNENAELAGGGQTDKYAEDTTTTANPATPAIPAAGEQCI